MASTTTFPTLTPSPAAPSSQGQGDQPSSQGQGDRPVVQGPEDSVPGVTQGSLDSLSAESAPAPAPLLDSAPPCQPSPSLAASGQSHQQAGSGQEKSPSPKRSGKKKKKEKKGQNNLLKRFLSPEAPASKKEKLEVDRDSDSSWSLSYNLHAYDVDPVISYGQL